MRSAAVIVSGLLVLFSSSRAFAIDPSDEKVAEFQRICSTKFPEPEDVAACVERAIDDFRIDALRAQDRDRDERLSKEQAADAERRRADEQKVAAARDAHIKQVLAHGSSEGYGKARWGMTPAQVRNLYPQAQSHDGLLVFEEKIERFKSVVAFRFINGHLTAVMVAIDREQHLPMSAEEVNGSVRRLLVAKYGEPTSRTDDTDTWSTPSGLTKITLGFTPLDLHATSAIAYQSEELAGLEEKLNTAAASEKL